MMVVAAESKYEWFSGDLVIVDNLISAGRYRYYSVNKFFGEMGGRLHKLS